MAYLQFISDEKLIAAVQRVVSVIKDSESKSSSSLFSNGVDPFSALFDGVVHNLPFQKWIENESKRQIQKTMQNAIGDFHQAILGNTKGSEDLRTGDIVDFRNKKRKIIAEIKNKHNTTKGNHQKQVYNDLEAALKILDHSGYVAYCVHIIPKNGKKYNKLFTPSDNLARKKMNENEAIRLVDGISFYSLITGEPDALMQLYSVLPEVIESVSRVKLSEEELERYRELFGRTYCG